MATDETIQDTLRAMAGKPEVVTDDVTEIAKQLATENEALKGQLVKLKGRIQEIAAAENEALKGQLVKLKGRIQEIAAAENAMRFTFGYFREAAEAKLDGLNRLAADA